MKFKTTEDGKAFFMNENGQPVSIGDDGAEKPYDADGVARRLAKLLEDQAKLQSELKEARERYKPLAEVKDLAAYMAKAKKDAETVAALEGKDRDSEANIQKRVAEAIKAAVSPLEGERDTLKAELAKTTGELHRAIIGNAFGTSRYALEKLVSPALARQIFENSFYVKDGRPIGRDAAGKDIYGSEGLADFDVALSRLVEASPFKDNILKPTPGGSGGDGSRNEPKPGAMTAEQAGKLSMQAYMKARKEGKI